MVVVNAFKAQGRGSRCTCGAVSGPHYTKVDCVVTTLVTTQCSNAPAVPSPPWPHYSPFPANFAIKSLILSSLLARPFPKPRRQSSPRPPSHEADVPSSYMSHAGKLPTLHISPTQKPTGRMLSLSSSPAANSIPRLCPGSHLSNQH
jgi:hypothetical protein